MIPTTGLWAQMFANSPIYKAAQAAKANGAAAKAAGVQPMNYAQAQAARAAVAQNPGLITPGMTNVQQMQAYRSAAGMTPPVAPPGGTMGAPDAVGGAPTGGLMAPPSVNQAPPDMSQNPDFNAQVDQMAVSAPAVNGAMPQQSWIQKLRARGAMNQQNSPNRWGLGDAFQRGGMDLMQGRPYGSGVSNLGMGGPGRMY